MKKNKHQKKENNDRDDKIQLNGKIEEALPGTWFRIRIDEYASSGGNSSLVLATLSGKLRQNHIHLLPGDNVVIEVSPYDMSRGRVVWRK